MSVTKASTSSINTFAKYNKASAVSAGGGSLPGPGLFITTPYNSSTYYSSPDGVTWTARNMISQGGSQQAPPALLNNGEVYMINNVYENRSSNGTTWKNSTSGVQYLGPMNNGNVFDAKVKDGQVYRFGTYGGQAQFWVDGVGVYPTTNSQNSGKGGITFFKDLWIIAQQTQGGQRIFTSSTGGFSWTVYNVFTETSNSGQYVSIASNDTIAVAAWSGASTSYGIWSSTNGTTWTKRASINSLGARVQYVNDRFFWGGESGQVRYSTNGTTWTSVSSQLTDFVTGFAWNGSVYAAVDRGGRIMSSPDGITWTLRASGLVGQLALAYL